MNAEETLRRGQQYCMRHHCGSKTCPLFNKICINDVGELIVPDRETNFIIFSGYFNLMISELYKEG